MNVFEKACYSAVDKLAAESQYESRKQVGALIKGGVTSEAKLIKRFTALSNSQRQTAAWMIGRLGKRSFVPLLLVTMEADRSAAVRGQAGVSLSMLGGKAALRGLLRLATKSKLKHSTRESVAYSLSFLGEAGALDTLLAWFANEKEDTNLRGQCAEGIANLLGGADRRTKIWKRAVTVLLPGLKDDNTELRFWTIFALGSLRATAALPSLRKLVKADENVMSSMGWEVGEEATDAISWIQGKRLKDDAYTRSQKKHQQ